MIVLQTLNPYTPLIGKENPKKNPKEQRPENEIKMSPP